MSSSSEQELQNLNNIYLSGGKNKNSWALFLKDINDGAFNKKIIEFLEKNMKENPKNELTIDIIAFIMDFGNQNIINLIGQKQFQNIFINLLKSETNAGIENQKKVIYLTQKWAKKFNGNPNLTVFGENYNLLKKSGIVFPPETFIIKTYDKFVNKNEIINFNNNQKKNIQNNDNEFSLFNNNNNEFNQSQENQNNNSNYNNNYNNSNNKNDEDNNKFYTNRPNDYFNPNINYNNSGNNYNNNYNQSNPNNSNYNNNNYNQEKIKNPFEENSFNNNNNNNYNNYQMNNNQNDGFPMGNNDGFPRNNNYNNNFNNQNNNNPFLNNNPYELEETNPYADNNYNNYSSNNNNYSNNNSDALMLVDIWKNKIKTYNSYIEEGKFSYHATKLKEGINDILNNLSLIDDKIKQCMERGDDQGRRNLSFIKQDMEQTCFRYQCLKNDKKLEPFKSAFEGNTRRYFFDRENLFKEKKYIPYSHVEKENKVLTGLEKFGHTLKDGAFFVGKKIKNAAVGDMIMSKKNGVMIKTLLKQILIATILLVVPLIIIKIIIIIAVIIIIVVIVITIKIIITIIVIIIILEDL